MSEKLKNSSLNSRKRCRIEEAEASQAAELEDAQKRIAKLTEERDRLQDTLDAVMEIKGSQEELHTTATRLSLLGNV